MAKTNSERLDFLEEEVENIAVCVSEIKGRLGNGLGARVKLIERMQWWQIGIMVTMIAALVGGMWTMLRQGSQTSRENQALILQHIEATGQPSSVAPSK